MKKFTQSLLIIVAAAAGFTACKKEALPSNNAPSVAMETQSVRDNFPPLKTAPKLVKKGNDSLVYNADGSLQKVMVSASDYRTYVKTGNILTVTYFQNNLSVGKVEYTLDAAGRAVEDKHIGFPANNGNSPQYVYQYDGNNHLIKRYNKAHPTVRMEFAWGQDTKQLDLVKWYSGNNQNIALYITYKPETDHVKTWSKRTGLDSYLNIFGGRPPKMIASEDIQNYDTPALNAHEYFSYQYNGDGYPVKQDVHKFPTWDYVKTIQYKYSEQ